MSFVSLWFLTQRADKPAQEGKILINWGDNYPQTIPMTTHFISAEIDRQETPQQLQQEIEKELAKRG